MKIKSIPLTVEDLVIRKAVLQRSIINPLVERTIAKIREGQSMYAAELHLSTVARNAGMNDAKSNLADSIIMLARRVLLTPPVRTANNSLETFALCEEVCEKSNFPTIGGASRVTLNLQEILK